MGISALHHGFVIIYSESMLFSARSERLAKVAGFKVVNIEINHGGFIS